MQKMKGNRYVIRLSNFYAGGLIAVSLIILQGFIGLGKLDPLALVSVAFFAVALPFLSGILVVNAIEGEHRSRFSSPIVVRVVDTCFFIGVLAATGGVAIALWHMSWIAGVSFLAALGIASVVYSFYIHGLR